MPPAHNLRPREYLERRTRSVVNELGCQSLFAKSGARKPEHAVLAYLLSPHIQSLIKIKIK